MKRLLICIAFAISNLALFAQKTSAPAPFILQGKLTNYPEKYFFLQTYDEKRHRSIDSIRVNEDGSFYFKSTKPVKTQKAMFGSGSLFYSYIFVAPGYNLMLTSVAKEFTAVSFRQNRKIDGIGSRSNSFLFKKDSLENIQRNAKAWFDMNNKELIAFLKVQNHTNDSLYHAVFDKDPGNDRHFGYFKKMVSLDNTFENFYFVQAHASYDTASDATEMKALVNNNVDKKILNDLYNEKNLISGWYMQAMLDYPYYLRKLGCKETPVNCNGKNYNAVLLETVAKTYTGKIKQIVLLNFINNYLTYCRSFAELNAYKKEFPPFVSLLDDKKDQQKIDTLFAKMEKTLLQTQIGQPAPLFTAEDSTGRQYNIESYKGKVVYLDLWASWCGPCRHETPYLKKLVDKFSRDTSLTFISVAVLDKKDKWKEALMTDTPQWLQLFDASGAVQSAYVANSIPKFILINKEGKIVSFDAPVPSSGDEIEKLLRKEIEK